MKAGQRVVWGGTVHGTVVKRIKRNPVVCYVRLDRGPIKPFLERELRPEPVIINLAAPLYVRRRGKRRKGGGKSNIKKISPLGDRFRGAAGGSIVAPLTEAQKQRSLTPHHGPKGISKLPSARIISGGRPESQRRG